MNDTATNQTVTDEGTGVLHITPGEWVRINWPGSQYDKREGQVKYPSDTVKSFLVEFPDGSNNWFGLNQIEAMPQLWPANATMEEMREVVRRLNNDLNEVKLQSESRNTRITQLQEIYRDDMAHIEEVLQQAKEDNGWCDEGWNKYASRVNSGLRGSWEFDLAEEEFELTIEVTGTMRATVTTTITATSEEAAWEIFDNDPDSYIDVDEALTEAASSESFDDIQMDRY